MSKVKAWLIIFLNAVIICAIITCLYFMWTRSIDYETYVGPLQQRMFLYVNADASVLLGLGCIMMIIAAIMYLAQNRPNLHYLRYAFVFKMVATVWSAFVFLLIVLFLGPMVHYPLYLFECEQSVLNVVLPILAVFIFIFLEYKKTSKVVIVYSAIPAILYIAAMFVVVFTGVCQKAINEEAPYEIFYFKTNPIYISVLACVCLIGGTFAIGAGIYFANKAMFEKAYPRIASTRYQHRLQKMKNEG